MPRVRDAVKDSATPVGHVCVILKLLCEEYGPRQRRRLRSMLSAIMRAQLREPLEESLDKFERQVKAYEDQRGEDTPTSPSGLRCNSKHAR